MHGYYLKGYTLVKYAVDLLCDVNPGVKSKFRVININPEKLPIEQ